MKWIALTTALLVIVFAVSAFVSRDKECSGGSNRSGHRTCEVTYWWD